MIALVILFAILVTFFLNFAFAKKIQNKTYRFFMDAANVLLALIFVVLFVVTGTVQKNMNSFIDYEISQLEKNANEIYPGALDAQMNTAELKDLLEKSLKKNASGGLDAIAENIIKSKIEKYTESALKAINALERTEDKLSVKDALVSIKELSVKAVTPYFKIIKILLVVLYIILALISMLLSNYMKNEDTQNKGIVFGEEADKTSLGMENK